MPQRKCIFRFCLLKLNKEVFFRGGSSKIPLLFTRIIELMALLKWIIFCNEWCNANLKVSHACLNLSLIDLLHSIFIRIASEFTRQHVLYLILRRSYLLACWVTSRQSQNWLSYFLKSITISCYPFISLVDSLIRLLNGLSRAKETCGPHPRPSLKQMEVTPLASCFNRGGRIFVRKKRMSE